MFETGQYIIYGSTGVCKIEDIRNERISGEQRSYYILRPVYINGSKIYAPFGMSEVRMHKLITRDEAMSLINAMPDEETIWIDDDNARKEKYTEIVKSGDRAALSRMLKTLYNKQKEKLACGKKFHSADERIMKDAEKILFEELALVLEIEPSEVLDFIHDELEAQSAGA